MQHVKVALRSALSVGLVAALAASGLSCKKTPPTPDPIALAQFVRALPNDVGAGLAVGNDDAGARRYDALAACLAKLKSASPDFASEHEIVLSANADVPYKEVLHTVDIVRGEHGDLFPDVMLGVAR
jgi:hypothetical protein